MRPRSEDKGIRRSPEEWQLLIKEHQDSNQTIRAFCYHHGLDEQYFSKKRRQLGYPRTRSIALSVKRPPSTFIPVAIGDSVSPSGAQLQLSFHSSQLTLPSTTSAHWLSELLRGLS